MSNNNTPHRLVGILGYKIEYGKNVGAATSINLGYIGEQAGPFSYSYGGDMNGDRVNNNDLIFVPLKASDIQFSNIIASDLNSALRGTPAGNVIVYTPAQQVSAFDQYIDQDKYLSTRRGQYVERNGGVLPMLHRLDLSATQDFYITIAGKKNNFQFRADILNFTNFIIKIGVLHKE